MIIFIIKLILFLENFVPCEFVVKEEIEMNFENNEEAGPSGIVVEKEIETDEAAGKRNSFFSVLICFIAYIKFMQTERCVGLIKSQFYL